MKNDNMPETGLNPYPPHRPWPSKLFVETTTRCNLRCRMCVKETWDRSTMEGEMKEETFAKLAPAFQHLEALVLNGVGEPLMDARLEIFIREARRAMPAGAWIGFQSNGMLMDAGRAHSLVEAGVDRICISADALNPDIFREIRRGGEEQGVERAFAVLHEARELRARPDVKLGLEFVLMRDNARELPRLLHRAAELGASFAIVTHILPYAESSVSQTAFDSNMDGAVELFNEWKIKAGSEGLDLGDYFGVLWKYMRKPSDEELADFILEIAAVASRDKGVEQVWEILGSSLPGKQITIKSFSDTRGQLLHLFGDDKGWRDALDCIFSAITGDDLLGEYGAKHALALVWRWKETELYGGGKLLDYLTVIWKYSRTPAEQRLFEMAESMKSEARARDISLHLKNLMERDEQWAADLERIFTEAREIARETGIDLDLPASSPSSVRRCDFVEEGSAFVSWNGNVHPCYFLWHQYGCHLFGRKKFVNARSFGNVHESGILDIWNSSAFKGFRKDVLAYDYPYCSNCNVVPCQYLMAEEFEQDCYGNTIPCGDCFWCMGLFKCLR